MQIEVYKNSTELCKKTAAWIAGYINETLEKQDRFSIALSGGNTPRELYRHLAQDYKDQINWSAIDFFWGDERFVSYEDENNNGKMAADNLLDRVAVDPVHIFQMRTDIDPEISAEQYEEVLEARFPGEKTFDLVLMGLGDNVHTLSLFPNYPVIHEKDHWVRSLYVKELEMYRITLTAPVVNLAQRVLFLVTGSSKAEAVRHAIQGKFMPDHYPAQVIKPVNGELYWFLDEEAAAHLTNL
jgi:6-phosphogluconolactonase